MKCTEYGCANDAVNGTTKCPKHKGNKIFIPTKEGDKDSCNGVKKCPVCGTGKCQASEPGKCLV